MAGNVIVEFRGDEEGMYQVNPTTVVSIHTLRDGMAKSGHNVTEVIDNKFSVTTKVYMDSLNNKFVRWSVAGEVYVR